MIRILYVCLVLMHPPALRRRFGDEMLCTFGEAAACGGALGLLADGFVSVGRQWNLRSGAWRMAAAVLGAGAQVTAGGPIWWRPEATADCTDRLTTTPR